MREREPQREPALGFLPPGSLIEILAYTDEEGIEHWTRYTISDWEIPWIGKDGRYRFHAVSEHSPTGTPCPMVVDPLRFRHLETD